MTHAAVLTNGVGMSQEQAIDVDDIGNGVEDGSLNDNMVIPSTFPEQEGGAPTTIIAADHDSPLFVSEGSPSAASEDVGEAINMEAVIRDGFAVIVPPVVNAWEYRRYEEPPQVVEILEDYDDGGFMEYLVRFDDENEEVVSL